VLPDVIKVVIDYNGASSNKKKKIDTGMFTCIHKGKSTKNDHATIGSKICLKGEQIQLPKKAKPKIKYHIPSNKNITYT
jgi:hypothetical protein